MKLIIFGLFFYLLYFLIKYLFLKPFKQGFANGGRGNDNWNRPQNKTKEGEVTIDFNPSKDKGRNSEIGEYVDYEEVD